MMYWYVGVDDDAAKSPLYISYSSLSALSAFSAVKFLW